MKTIYKYAVDVAITADMFDIEMPVGAEVLCVQMQGKGPKIWAVVDLTMPKVPRRFHWRGTGHPADGLGRYIGTIQEMDGALVFHLFEALK